MGGAGPALQAPSPQLPPLVLGAGRGAEGPGSSSTAFGPYICRCWSSLAQKLPPSCCTGRQSQGQRLLDRSHLHALSFVPRDGCEQRVCMPGPAAGQQRACGALTNPTATLGTGVQPGVPGLDALRRGDLAGRARCPKLTCCPCLRARVRVAGEDEPGFSTYLPAALPGPGLPLACCLTCEPMSVCFVSLRTHSPALSPRNITSLPAPPSTKQLGPLGPARLRTHGPGW